MKKKTGIIFDLDGTLLDTEKLIMESFYHVFKKYKPNYTLSTEELLSFLGPPLEISLKRYFDNCLVEEIISYYREFNYANHELYVTIYPTVIETLEWLKKEQYPLAIVTTKYSKAVNIGLEQFDMHTYFDAIIAIDNVQKTKPNPEGILKAMEQLHVSDAIMVGDNVSDIQAGKNAGIRTVAVKWASKGYDAMEKLKPDLRIDKMSDILKYIKEIGE